MPSSAPPPSSLPSAPEKLSRAVPFAPRSSSYPRTFPPKRSRSPRSRRRRSRSRWMRRRTMICLRLFKEGSDGFRWRRGRGGIWSRDLLEFTPFILLIFIEREERGRESCVDSSWGEHGLGADGASRERGGIFKTSQTRELGLTDTVDHPSCPICQSCCSLLGARLLPISPTPS